MLDLLKELCALSGVSGDEDAVREFIREKAAPYADDLRTDALGNLIVFKKGRKQTGNKLLLAAHMDEVGVIVTHITEDGFLKFDFVGGVDRRVAIGKPVVLGEKKIPGIIGLKAIHLVSREEMKKVPKTESLYIDIGAENKKAAEKLVELGTYGSFVGAPEEFGNGLLKAKAIDDRVGCAVMLELLKEDLPLDVTFAFTAQEEVGTRGAFGAAFSVTPEIALVLETTTAADLPGVDDHRKVCAPGKGPVISYMDGGTIYDRKLFEALRDLAEKNGIPWQTKEYIAGGNDARTIQRTKSGVRVAALSAAVRYLHAPASVGSVADFENMLKLTRLFLERMAGQEFEMELFELIQKLNAAHGPSGDEGGVRAVIADLARPYADEVHEDTMGNLIVRKKGSGPKVMFAAHMDSIGFIVTHIEKEGFLRVGRLGGVSPKEAAYTPVRFKNGVRGVLVPEEKADFGKLKLDECYIDIGAKDEDEARKMVQVGDTAIYDTSAFQNVGKVFSPYLDNRIACAILLRVLENLGECRNDVSLVFTAQEEVGLRGARTAAWTVDPDFGLAVDVTDVDDTPGSEKCGTVALGKGAAIKVMDSSVICHPAVVQKLTELAEAQGIPAQKDIMRAGGTDAGAIHTTRMGVRTGGVSVPCRYIHTPQEMADLHDAEHCVKLIAAFAQAELPNL